MQVCIGNNVKVIVSLLYYCANVVGPCKEMLLSKEAFNNKARKHFCIKILRAVINS